MTRRIRPQKPGDDGDDGATNPCRWYRSGDRPATSSGYAPAGTLRYVSVTFMQRSGDGKATMIGSARLVGPEGPTPDADQLKPSPCPRRAECSAEGSPRARAGGPGG